MDYTDYDDYNETLRECKEHFESCRSGSYKSEYCPLPNSGEEFMAVVRELATGRPRNVPCGTPMPMEDILHIESSAALVQGPYSGKTRFLLDQVKEDQDERSFVLYLTMKPKPEEKYTVTTKCLALLLSAVRNMNLYNCMHYFIHFYKSVVNEIVDEHGFLKAEYSGKGGYYADKVLTSLATPHEVKSITAERDREAYDPSKGRYPNYESPPADVEPSRELFFKPHDDPSAPTKRLHVVLVIDEAELLLIEKRKLCDVEFDQDLYGDFIGAVGAKNYKEYSLLDIIQDIVERSINLFNFRVPIIFASSSPRILQSCPHRPMILGAMMDVWSRKIKVEKGLS